MAQRLRVRQNSAAFLFGGLVALVLEVIGILYILPNSGALGAIWMLAASGGIILSFCNAISRGRAIESIDVKEISAGRPSIEAPLRQLDDLKAKHLISPAEHEQRRAEILASL